MKVAIVSDAVFPYHRGGKETRIFELSTRLARQGHDVNIYTMKWWDGPENTRSENGVTLHAISRKLPLYSGSRRSMLQGIYFGIACLKMVRVNFDTVDVDHMPYFPLFSMKLVCILKRRPLVATWHEVWGQDYWRQYLGRLGVVASWLEVLSAKVPDRIVAVSAHTADRLVSVLGATQPIHKVSNGIDFEAMAKVKASRERSDIVYVGRLLDHKNVDQLLLAIDFLKQKMPLVHLMVIGDGPERANLENLAKKLGLAKNVVFKGYVERDSDKYRLIKASRVFVMPSTREGFGIAALEAIALGVPVVTVDHVDNAARYLVTPETGKLCELSPKALSDAIEQVLAEQFVIATSKSARSYDWGTSVSNLIQEYVR